MKMTRDCFNIFPSGTLGVTPEEMANLMLGSIYDFVEMARPSYLQLIRIVIYNRNIMMQFTQALSAFVKRRGQSRSELF